jgi:hypothetical protein
MNTTIKTPLNMVTYDKFTDEQQHLINCSGDNPYDPRFITSDENNHIWWRKYNNCGMVNIDDFRICLDLTDQGYDCPNNIIVDFRDWFEVGDIKDDVNYPIHETDNYTDDETDDDDE